VWVENLRTEYLSFTSSTECRKRWTEAEERNRVGRVGHSIWSEQKMQKSDGPKWSASGRPAGELYDYVQRGIYRRSAFILLFLENESDQPVRNLGWLSYCWQLCKGFKRKGGYIVMHALVNGNPIKSSKDRGSVMMSSSYGADKNAEAPMIKFFVLVGFTYSLRQAI